MNIAVITFHCSYNYGSMLQAYAMQTYLEKLGHNVRIIDYVLSYDFRQYKLLRADRYLKKPAYLLSDLFFLPKTMRRKKRFTEFKDRFLKLTDKTYYDNDDMSELNDEFDAFICGSDQIWNIRCTNGVVKPYFLSFAADDKLKVSYAPSVAHSGIETTPEEDGLLRQYIERLDWVSVREESTVPFIRQYTERKVANVLDPTLLLEKADYLRIMDTAAKTDEKYIFFYTLQKNSEMIKYCSELSERTGFRVLYISKVNIKEFGKAKNIYGCSPLEFLEYIYHAEYIVTNSFHATVFSVNFEKKFCTFTTKGSGSRMKDLLKKLGLSDRIHSEGFDIDKETDYSAVDEKRSELLLESKEYLKNSLMGEK